MNSQALENSGKLKFQLLATACVLCAATIATALPAHAAAGRIGWVRSSFPKTSSTYQADSAYSYNSRSGTNTLTRTGLGSYQVQMAGLYSPTESGNVQVTAFNTSGYCMSDGSGHTGSTVTVNVLCFDALGVPADNNFTALYQSHFGNTGTATKGLATVLNSSPSASSTPAALSSYNSTGGTNTITHEDTGSYAVTLPGLSGYSGDVQVTASGSVAARCKVSDWGGSPLSVDVLCFDSAGAPADEEFSLAFTENEPYAIGTAATNYQAYAWTNKPMDHNIYVPYDSYNWNNLGNGRIGADEYVAGEYNILYPGTQPSYSTSNYIVTAYGNDSSYCNIDGWATGGASIECYAQGGTRISEEYDVSFQAWE